MTRLRLFIALPAVLFYSILFSRTVNVPLEDDYEALLAFLNQMRSTHGIFGKTSWFFAAQFNEYKLFFGRAVALIQLSLVGHVDLRILCAAGNASVFFLALVLWKMFLPERDLSSRLQLFLPASWLLFQLGYAETLNWAMPGLQNIPVIVFAFASIWLLINGRIWQGTTFMVLAIAASGNGMILIPLGAVILRKRFSQLLGWLFIGAACVAAYAYRYNLMASQSRAHHSVLETVLHPHPLYALAFVGNAAALPFPGIPHRVVVLMSLCLGFLICIGLVVYRRYFLRNQAIGYCVLFLALTSVGVSGLRNDLGIAHSLDSRYKIYSVGLLVLLWFAIAEKLTSRRILALAIAASVAFSMSMDLWGWRFLSSRNQRVIAGMRSYQASGVGPVLPYPNQGERFDELDAKAPLILKESEKLGIYSPPSE